MIPSRRRTWLLDLSPLLGAFTIAAFVAIGVSTAAGTGTGSGRASARVASEPESRGQIDASSPKLARAAAHGPSGPRTVGIDEWFDSARARSATSLSTTTLAASPVGSAGAGRERSDAELLPAGAGGPAVAVPAPLAAHAEDPNARRVSGFSADSSAWVQILGLVALVLIAFAVDKALRHRHSIADEVARQRETLRVTLASIGDGVMTTDTSGRILYLNGEAEALTGWTSAEAAGKPVERVFRIVNETTRLPVENPASRALAEGAVVGLARDTVLIGKDGTERPIGDIAAPIRDAKGRVSGVVLVFRDVADERAATNQLRALAVELSEADGRKNEFLAMLAHEIRNPLAAIRNSVAVLRLAHLDPGASASAQGAIQRQMEHLTRLVEDLLDVSRISHGKLALRRAPIDLRPAIEQAIEANGPIFASHGQSLEVAIEDSPLPVDADATRVTQAIGNLLSNASKFTPRAGKIRLAAGIENAEVVVRVRDDGIGIPPEHLAGLFDMFSQVDTSLERAQDGLGIGLHLVKQLVEMHGGHVEARSEGLGRGSEFIVRLPIPSRATVVAPVGPEPVPAVASLAAATSPIDLDSPESAPPDACRILVVDDNVDSADSLAMLLRLEGYATEVAHDGIEAVEIALRTLPDVVLLDIGLPRLNGYETARRIRLSPRGREIRLIALTGRGQDEDRRLTAAAGYDAHLVKPVDHGLLISLLAQPSRTTAAAAIR